MNPEHDGQLALGVGGREDIQVQAVLAGAAVLKDHVVVDVALEAASAVFGCVADALLFSRRLRRSPAEVADGGCGIGQAEKGFDFSFINGLALRLALCGLYGQ